MIKLHPSLIGKIREELNETVRKYGGRPVENGIYRFHASLGESARKTAEAATAMYQILRGYDRELYGVTVCVTGEPSGSSAAEIQSFEHILWRISEDDGLWVAGDVIEDLRRYLDGEMADGLFRVMALKDFGPRLEERLPRLMVRPDRLKVVRQALEMMERDESDRCVLLIRGRTGSGKRATLQHTLRELYPDDGGAPLTIPFSEDGDDPLEPFVRSLGIGAAATMEYLEDDERIWWEQEGSEIMERARRGLTWETSRDQGPVDFIQAFTLHVKAHLERRRQSGRPAYVVIDGFSPRSEAVNWLRTILTEFLGQDGFRLIIIRDSDDFEESLPIPAKGHEVSFRPPTPAEWAQLVREASPHDVPGEEEQRHLAELCGSNLIRLFHGLLARERGWNPEMNPYESLVGALDRDSRRLLFVSHTGSGLADRRLLVERVGPDENLRQSEAARYDSLLELGLLREDPDGRVRLPAGEPPAGALRDTELLREAARFGEFLHQRSREGEPLDLFRLYRYLEAWGPAERAIAVLDRLLESLLTNRRLRAAGRLLNGPPLAHLDLDAPETESLQNVVGAARLRYVLLTAGVDQARSLVRDGTVSLVSGRGAYSDRFRLHNARYFYALERWDDSLSAAKEALFTFQKAVEHEGETHSHIELALSLLAQGKVRDALEHFTIARRIGTQVSASWGVLRASAMEVVSQFLFGNLPRALRECREYRETARRAGRRDIWLLLTLVAVRITWDLGRCDESAELAEEGWKTARFYGLSCESSVMELWKARSLLRSAQPAARAAGRRLLTGAVDSREALAFLAEAAFLDGEVEQARLHLAEALRLPRRSCRLQGEADDWSDGYYPVEGRLTDGSGLLDALGERIGAFDAFLGALAGDESRIDHLRSLLDRDTRRGPRPFSYQYALWAAIASPEGEREEQTRFMSRAFNDLQARAGRFDDNQTKHAWLTANPWNRRIMEEAQRRRFL